MYKTVASTKKRWNVENLSFFVWFILKIKGSIFNIDEAVNLFEAIEYYKIMNIVENDIVYGKDDFEIAIKDIKNGDKLIEVETVANNNKINTIEKIKKQIIDLEIPIDATNFFVKKAEIELDKLMNR